MARPRLTVAVLAAARVVTGDGGVSASPAWVLVGGDHILAVGTGEPPMSEPSTAGTRWASDSVAHRDLLLAPGYVDMQVNGAGRIDFAQASVDEIVAAVGELADAGCSTCLPTLITAPLDAYDAMLARLAEARTRAPEIVGVHLEGPFIGGAPGAHPRDLIRPVDLEWLGSLCDRYGDLIRVVTLAPEADPGLQATRMLAARGVRVALGHSTATYDEARAAADAGASFVTHLFNGMSPLHHRDPGLPGAALDDHRLVPTIIGDLVHVHPAALRLAFTARPDTVLVTDRVAAAPGPARDAARLPDGTLSGAFVGMSSAVHNLVASGIAVGQAVRAASGNPARALGLGDRGRIAPGCRADLLWLDPDTLTVRGQWRAAGPRGS